MSLGRYRSKTQMLLLLFLRTSLQIPAVQSEITFNLILQPWI